MGRFGWSLPPGVSMRDIDPVDQPCGVCGKDVDTCICPECNICGATGDESCYLQHGLIRSPEQIDSFAAWEKEQDEAARQVVEDYGNPPEEAE